MGYGSLLGTMGILPRAGEVAVAALLGALVYRLLVRVERGHGQTALLTALVGCIAFESLVWDQASVPVGVFHPKFGGQNFRLYDVLIPLAVLARLRVGGLPKRISRLGLAVLAFCTWYACEALVGALRGYGTNEIIYEAKLVIYVGGGYFIAAGAPAEEVAGEHGLQRLVRPFAAATVALMALAAARHGVNLHIPTLKVSGLEGIQPDAATFLLGLGAISLLVELTRERRRWSMVLGSGVLIISGLASHQRAALVAMAAGAVVISAGWLVRAGGSRRVRITPTELIGAATLVVAGFSSYSLLNKRAPWHLQNLPLGSLLSATFGSVAKQQSAADRVAELHASATAIASHLPIGWGLGKSISYASAATNATVTTPSPDDMYLGILLRSGVLGMVLFAAMVVIAGLVVLRIWRYHSDRAVAAMAWGAGAIIVAFLARGAVEGLFEKYRLAIGFGLALGMLASASRSLSETPSVLSLSELQPAGRVVGSAPAGDR